MPYKNKKDKETYARTYYLQNHTSLRERQHEYYLQNRTRIRDQQHEYCLGHKRKYVQTEQGRINEKDKKMKLRASSRKQILDFLGGKCKRCGITDIRVLQIDHVNGNGYKEKKQLGLSSGNTHSYYRHIRDVNGVGYQILCANCNWIKRYEQKEHN